MAVAAPVEGVQRSADFVHAFERGLAVIRAFGRVFALRARVELEEGLRSVAVPVRDRTGAVVAALNVATPASRFPVERICTDLLPILQACAGAIEADLAIG